jgi:endonuclease YncB( thermonuclease family)
MTKLSKVLMSTLMAFFVTSASFAKGNKEIQSLSGKVVSCHDGDTCRVLLKDKNKEIKVRFAGIDTPELKQSYGKDAQRFTESLVKNQNVDLKCNGNSFDRVTCEVFLGQKSVNEEIVKSGWAWDSPKFSKGKFAQAMKEARAKKIGIWKDHVVSPFCFRHKDSRKCAVDQTYME